MERSIDWLCAHVSSGQTAASTAVVGSECLRVYIQSDQGQDIEAYVSKMAEVKERRNDVNYYHYGGLAELATWNHMGNGAVEVFSRNMSDHSLVRMYRLAAEGKAIEPLLRVEWAGYQVWEDPTPGFQAGTHWNIVLGL